MSSIFAWLGLGFNPGKIPGLALWVDACDTGSITLVTGRASQWNDKSGKGNHALQGTAGSRPLYVASAINGKPALQFYDDGSAKMMSAPDHASLDYTACTMFVVFTRLTDLNNNERIAGKHSGTSPSNQREVCFKVLGSSGDVFQISTSSNGSAENGLGGTTKVISTNTPYIGDGLFTASTGTVRVNNEAATQVTGVISGLFNGTSPFHIGAVDGAGAPFAGYVGEILFFTAALSAASRMQVMNYLSQKWRITIAP